MATAGDIVVKFGVNLNDFNKKLSDAERAMKRTGERFEKIGSAMNSMFTAPILGATAALTALAVKSGAVEKEQKKLEASMEKLGASVADVVGPAMESMAASVEKAADWFASLDTETKQTILTVGLAVAAIGPLATGYGKLNKLMAENVGLLKDGVSGFMKMNAVTVGLGLALGATVITVKALGGDLESLGTIAKRVALMFEGLAEMIVTALTAAGSGVVAIVTGDFSSLSRIASAASQGFADAWKKMETGAAGSEAQVKASSSAIVDAVSDITSEFVGNAGAATEMAAATGKAAQDGKDEWAKYREAIVANFAASQDAWAEQDASLRALVDPIEQVTMAAEEMADALLEASNIDFDAGGLKMTGMAVTGQVPQMVGMGMDTIAPGLGSALMPIIEAAAKTEEEARAEIEAMLQASADQLENILSNLDVIFVTFIKNLPQVFIGLIRGMWDMFTDFLSMIWEVYSGIWKALWEGLSKAFDWFVNDLGDWIKKDVPDALRGFFTEWLPQAFKDAGQWIKQAVIDGWEWVKNGFLGVFESFINFFIDVLNGLLRAVEAIIPFEQDWTGLEHVSFRAKGGPVSAGNPYIVGEEGPEMFVPSSSGAIVPNDAMGGITVNIHGGSEDAETIARKTVRAIRDAKRLGLLDVPMVAGLGVA